MKENYTLDMLWKLDFHIQKPSLIFLYGDLWAGKTTLSKSIIHGMLWDEVSVTSPTYVYYNVYSDIYHFDLYRLRDYDEFVSIWGEEILDNNQGIIIIEWPEILEPYYNPDIKIFLEKTDDETIRSYPIQYN